MIIVVALLLAPALPLLGLQAFAFHAAAFAAFASALSNRRHQVVLRGPEAALILLVMAYACSLAYAFSFGAPKDRFIGSAYNLSFWMMGLFVLLSLGSGVTPKLQRSVLRAVHLIFCASALVGVVALALWVSGVKEAKLSAPVTIVGGDSVLVETSNSINILHRDWLFGRSWPRTSGFANYATAYGAVLALSWIGSITARRLGAVRRRRVHLLLIPGAVIGLILSGSRGTMLGLGAVLALGALRRGGSRARVGMAILVGMALLAGAGSFIVRDLTGGDGERFRPGSTQTRLDLYERSLEVWKLSPVIGVGIKPKRYEKFPVGSHSTYVGLLMRTGVVGLGMLLLFLVAMFRDLSRRIRSATSRVASELAGMGMSALIFTTVWMAGDDLDAPQLVAFLFFALLGLARGGSRETAGLATRTPSRARLLAGVGS